MILNTLYNSLTFCGGVAEWFKAAVLKTVEDLKSSVGSNPTSSAGFVAMVGFDLT